MSIRTGPGRTLQIQKLISLKRLFTLKFFLLGRLLAECGQQQAVDVSLK